MNLYPHFRLLQRAHPRRACTLELSHDELRKTWNIPHGPPLQPHERHLAVELAGNPSASQMVADCWDAGPAEIRKWTPRQIVVVLHGARLRGCFSFVRFRNTGQPHWLWVRVTTRARAPRSQPALANLTP